MNLKSEEFKEFIIFLSIVLLIILIFSFILFGVTGVRVFLGIIFMSIPFYFILNNFELSENEKFIFSLLLGITAFPSLVYILGFVISFRIAILIIFVLLVSISILLWKFS